VRAPTPGGGRRRLCVVTGNRADYGLLRWLLHDLQRAPDVDLLVVVAAQHLDPTRGHTVDVIVDDGFPIAATVPMLEEGDSPHAMARSLGLGVLGFADAFAGLGPDLVVLLGDRFETLAAAVAAATMTLPIAHLHGGELSAGAIDDAYRHAISKLSHLHFTAAPEYAARLARMGEAPERIFVVGALGLDNVDRLEPLDRSVLEGELGVELSPPLLLVTYHPATAASIVESLAGLEELLAALDRFPQATVLATMANVDAGGGALNQRLSAFAEERRPRVSLVASLGAQRYLSALRLADAVVGNSSSGLIEAPALGTPTVNVGPRQDGRLRARSVLDCPPQREAIAAAIRRALTPGQRTALRDPDPPYGRHRDAARRTTRILRTVDLSLLRTKRFHDGEAGSPPSPLQPGTRSSARKPSPPPSALASPVLLIAEAGVNHNGSLDLALQLVDAAARAGADAVKFQTFRADTLATAAAPKAAYQRRTGATTETQRQMLAALELDESALRTLAERCAQRGIELMSSPFDAESVTLLAAGLRLRRLKVGSGELTNGPLLLAIARTGLSVLLSTGMATLDEVGEALGVLAFGLTGSTSPSRAAFRQALSSPAGRQALQDHVILLHCTSAYPAPPEEANLRAIDTLSQAFGLPVGLSDHTLGSEVAVAAVARGATVIEKHLTLDRALPGPDQAASLLPDELAALVRAVRKVERALGSPLKRPAPSEADTAAAARRSLVALAPIRRGELFSAANVGARRPAGGPSPMQWWEVLGRRAPRDFAADEPIEAGTE
jgi:N-acetylneuraminate synthase/UDP-hydrolysing UDP-N-acetyl-D-glucosamine 2-epimerase